MEPHIHRHHANRRTTELNQSGTLFEGIERWAERKALLTHDDVKQRAWQTLKWQIANGIQHVRTHVDVSGCNANCAESNAGSEAGSRAVD